MELKGYKIGGCTVIAENKDEALTMYMNEIGCKLHFESSEIKIEEQNLDEIFYYFNINQIEPEDYKYIYDRRYPSEGVELVSLKRPYAKKYCNVIGDKKEILFWYI